MAFPHSIRWQIQAWHGALLVLITSVLLFSFWGYEQQQRYSRIDERLQAALLMALPVTHIDRGPGGGPKGGPPRREELELELGFGGFLFTDPQRRGGPPPPREERDRPETTRAREYLSALEKTNLYVVAINDRKREIVRTANAPPTVPPPAKAGSDGETQTRMRDGFRELIHFRPRQDMVIVGTSVADVTAALRKLALSLLGIGSAVVGVGLLGGWWLASRAMRPIAEISATAEMIADGDLTRRIDTHGAQSELGRLASLLNHTFERLHDTFEQQAQFTADASHELRTPISVILAQTELALMRERSPGEYREALEACQRSGAQMKAVVNSLLELARLDAGDLDLKPTVIDLAEVLQAAVLFIKPLAEQRQATVLADLESVHAKADGDKLQQVATNLLTNAIKHNPEGGTVRVSLSSEGAEAVIRVSDNGSGIPADVLPRVFERFVRADKARSRPEGSTGLGLSIVKAVVEAHGGTVTASSSESKGSEFVVRLPIEG
jgi:two-component system, OmpR family, sensor kinase